MKQRLLGLVWDCWHSSSDIFSLLSASCPSVSEYHLSPLSSPHGENKMAIKDHKFNWHWSTTMMRIIPVFPKLCFKILSRERMDYWWFSYYLIMEHPIPAWIHLLKLLRFSFIIDAILSLIFSPQLKVNETVHTYVSASSL
jgi:hypothetical protein